MRAEWPLAITLATMALFSLFGEAWLTGRSGASWFFFVLAWLFVALLVSAFAVVRHAKALAVLLNEPFGTLVLTIAMSGMEMIMIAAVMYVGHGESSLGRDTMLSIIMIVLNGFIGTSLLLGGLRYPDRKCNLHGATNFLSVIIALSVLGLVLPRFTVSSLGPASSIPQAGFLVLMSLSFYGIFLAIQTLRHRDRHRVLAEVVASGTVLYRPEPEARAQRAREDRNPRHYHTALLLVHAIPFVFLAKQIAVPIDYGISVLGAPAAIAGLAVAILVLSAESLAVVRAALGNVLPRSIEVSLQTALSSIGITIPAVLAIGYMMNRTTIFGLDAPDVALLGVTLFFSVLTFSLQLSPDRTKVLLGVIHLLLFFAYLMRIFGE